MMSRHANGSPAPDAHLATQAPRRSNQRGVGGSGAPDLS